MPADVIGSSRRAEILIVGAGPAGLSTWLHLHALAPELAAQAVLIDKAVHPRDKLCGGGVTALGQMLLQGLGLDVCEQGVAIGEIEFNLHDHVDRICTPGLLRVVRRREFDHALARAALERGCDLHQGEAFVHAAPGDGGMCVSTDRAEYNVRVLVGADGSHSAVRRSLGLADDLRLARLLEAVCPVDPHTAPEFAGPTAIFDFRPMSAGVQGYAWHFPCFVDGLPAVSRGIYDSRLNPERPRTSLRALFADILTAAGTDPTEVTWHSHPVRYFSPDAILSCANAFLIGDAAGVDPVLGEGIAPSLDFGDFAANIIIAACSRGDFSFSDYQQRLSSHALGRALGNWTRLAYLAYVQPIDRSAMTSLIRLRLS